MVGKCLEFVTVLSGGVRMWCWLHDLGTVRALAGTVGLFFLVLALLARFCEGICPTRENNGV